MRWNRSAEQDGTLAEVNMTPLIDVSLVLVIILLLATPLAFESMLGLKRTQTAQTATSEDAVAPRVSVEILSNTQVRVNDVTIDVRALAATIAPLITASDNKEVAVRCADRVSHGIFVQVLDIMKLSGAAAIAVARN
jgi:biopolymer transport protein ExbD